LDLIFISNDITVSSCIIGPPLLNDNNLTSSDHNCVLTKLKLPNQAKICDDFNLIYDMRKRFVNNFVDTIRLYDWDNFVTCSGNIESKTLIFQTVIEDAFRKTIPKRSVPKSHDDKPWITPFIKSLIHDRWSAYRAGNFSRYKSLSVLIKNKITEAKQTWSNRCTKQSDL
jgi:hypothetical protein